MCLTKWTLYESQERDIWDDVSVSNFDSNQSPAIFSLDGILRLIRPQPAPLTFNYRLLITVILCTGWIKLKGSYVDKTYVLHVSMIIKEISVFNYGIKKCNN